MDVGISILRESRLAKLIERVERGEPVDFAKEEILLSLDLARTKELYLLQAMEYQEEQNGSVKRFLESVHGEGRGNVTAAG